MDDFDFTLPDALIALRPARPRPASRMLMARGDDLLDSTVAQLPRNLRAGDVLVLNDTRVIPARLLGVRRRGAGEVKLEATLLKREAADVWSALARPAKRLREEDDLRFGGGLSGRVAEKGEGGALTILFDRAGAELDAAIAVAGVMPLPPYIAARRPPDSADFEDYQTVFAANPGAVAAPTASLHFDEALLAEIERAGVRIVRLTLHVGAGTFLPVKTETVAAHKMHAEWGEVTPQTAAAVNAARAAGGRVIAAGTTALRLLESAADETGILQPWRGETDIFITPGYRFRIVDALMTNFHLPRSTLFMLVCAFMGAARMRATYAEAIARGYRFYSYGDSSLLIPHE